MPSRRSSQASEARAPPPDYASSVASSASHKPRSSHHHHHEHPHRSRSSSRHSHISRSSAVSSLPEKVPPVHAFQVADGGKATEASSDDTVKKRTLYIVIAVAIVAIIVVGLIGHFATSCPAGAGKPTTTVAPPVTPPPGPPESAYYLPSSLKPLHYDLLFKVYLPDSAVKAADTFRFDGTWAATFLCRQATNKIILHFNAMNLTTTSFALSNLNGTDQSLKVIQRQPSWNAKTQIGVFSLSGNCVAGRVYKLSLTYRAWLNQDLFGLYRSSYTEKGAKRWLAVTQFEPIDARRAFPCWDEPAWKATYSVQVLAPVQYQALSNGIKTDRTKMANGWALTKFSQTPPMSSYLVALAVVDFDFVERTTPDGKVRFRIWARRELVQYLTYAANVGAQALTLYTKLFKVPFPLPKQDMLAVPDFDAGAMENWGLVTYRETAIMYEQSAPFRTYTAQRVAVVIVHELAHQWFGDLVTMAWWNDLFLNEGFADYIEYIGTDQIPMSNRTFHMDEQFVDISTHAAMDVDQTHSSRAIAGHIAPTTNSINQLFDAITYDKGGAVLKMLNFTMTKPNFIAGLQAYMERYKFSNANHNNLWAMLTPAAKSIKDWNGKPLNVTTFMNPWVEQMGFPLVTAKRSGQTVTLTQSRFLIDNGTSPTSAYGYQWYIPIWYQAGSYVSGLLWLQPGQSTTIHLPSNAPYFLLNYQVRAFYRSHYDAASWTAIQNQLNANASVFDDRNRAQIVADALALAKAGTIGYGQAIQILNYLRAETNYIPWDAASPSLDFMEKMFSLDVNYAIFRAYMQALVQPLYKVETWNNAQDPPLAVLKHFTRIYAVSTACRYGLTDCQTQALNRFTAFQINCQSSYQNGGGSFKCSGVAPDLRRTVYCQGIKHGTYAEWAWMWQLFLNEQVSEERNSLMYGLACSQEPWVLRKLLGEGLSAKNIRSQDVRYTFAYVGQNPVGRELLWNFVSLNWATLRRQYAQSFGFSVSRIVNAATSHFNTPYQVAQLKAFLAANDVGSASGAFAAALERAQTQANWMQRYYTPVLQAFKASLPSHDAAALPLLDYHLQ